MRGYELLENMTLIDAAYLEAAEESPPARKRRWLKYGIIAACLCMISGLVWLGAPNPANAFSIKACALEAAADGTFTLKETDLLEQPDVWGGHFDGECFYAGVGLRYDGNNIKSVTFSTEEGFFAKQYISQLSSETVSRLYVGAENQLVMVGTEFEIVGASVTLDGETMTDDLLLFWGTQAAGANDFPRHIDLKAAAVFRDGRKQEIPVSIDLSSTGVMSSSASEEEVQASQKRWEYYHNIPLEDCELLEESIQKVTDVYEVQVGIGTEMVRDFDKMEFDEKGISRRGVSEDVSGTVHITVIQRDSDGEYTGMVYRVPEALRYPEE